MRIALINGRRTAYTISGDPDGQPVLIIHGAWGGPASTLWHGPRLRWAAPTDGLRLIWYDRRCAGLSAYAAEPFTLADLAQDAAALLDYLSVERAAVIATSAGGPIGLRLALDQPERVARLVLLNTGAALMSLTPLTSSGVLRDDPFVRDRLETVVRRLALLDQAASDGAQAAVAETESEWRTPPDAGAADPDDPALLRARANRRTALVRLPFAELARLAAGALRNMRAQAGVDLTSELGRLRCPTLVVHDEADSTVPHAYGQALAQRIPDAQFVSLPDAGHGLIVQLEAQRIVSRWLTQPLPAPPEL